MTTSTVAIGHLCHPTPRALRPHPTADLRPRTSEPAADALKVCFLFYRSKRIVSRSRVPTVRRVHTTTLSIQFDYCLSTPTRVQIKLSINVVARPSTPRTRRVLAIHSSRGRGSRSVAPRAERTRPAWARGTLDTKLPAATADDADVRPG